MRESTVFRRPREPDVIFLREAVAKGRSFVSDAATPPLGGLEPSFVDAQGLDFRFEGR